MKALRSMPRVLCLLLVLTGIALAQPARFEQVGQWVSQGRFQEAAEELQQASLRSGRSLEQPRPVEEKILRKVIERARTFVNGQHPLQERNAARQVLCLSRAYFPEEISKIDQALRVGGGVHRPELIGEAVAVPMPSQARKAGIQGIVIVEVVVEPGGVRTQFQGPERAADGHRHHHLGHGPELDVSAATRDASPWPCTTP